MSPSTASLYDSLLKAFHQLLVEMDIFFCPILATGEGQALWMNGNCCAPQTWGVLLCLVCHVGLGWVDSKALSQRHGPISALPTPAWYWQFVKARSCHQGQTTWIIKCFIWPWDWIIQWLLIWTQSHYISSEETAQSSDSARNIGIGLLWGGS